MDDNPILEIPVLYNKELEQNLLGGILINPPVMDEILDMISGSDFGTHANQFIFDAMKRIYSRNEPVDITTLTDELTRNKNLDDVGGVPFLFGLMNNALESSNAFHVPSYAKRIRDYARRRNIISAANELAKAAYNTQKDIENNVSDIVERIVDGVSVGKEIKHWGEAVERVFKKTNDNIERYKKEGDKFSVDGIPTGFADFDNITGGGHGGELIYIAGEPAVGKSILANQMMFNIARIPNTYAVVFSLEMGEEQVARRLMSAWTGIPVPNMRLGRIDDEQYISLVEHTERNQEVRLYIDDSPSITIEEIRAKIKRLRLKLKNLVLGAILIDYSLLITAPGLTETERATYISKNMKELARDKSLNVPIFAIQSVNKAGMDNNTAPAKSNMRSSGQQIHDADTIMFVLAHVPEKDEKPNPNLVTCLFTKIREPLAEFRVFNLQIKKESGVPAFHPMSTYVSDGSEEIF